MAAPREMFGVSGVSHDVGYARAAAFQSLMLTLGPMENPAEWQFAEGQYEPAEVPDADGDPQPACRFTIKYVRVPQEVEA